MARNTKGRRGTLGQRLLLGILSVVLTLLFIWLLGFIVRDVGEIDAPDATAIELRHVGQESADRLADLVRRREELERQIARERQRQATLERSAQSAETSMKQLLELHRLQLEKGVEPTEAEQSAFEESERLFLDAQRSFQEANARIAKLEEEVESVEEDRRALDESLDPLREAAKEEYAEAVRASELHAAAYKLAVILPILVVAAWFVLVKRQSAYRVVFISLLLAAAWRVAVVIHEHFPTRVFNYIATATGIVLVIAAIVVLVRRALTPAPELLLRQNREAYRRHLCPVCSEPILRGPLRWARWSRNGPKDPALRPEYAVAAGVAGAADRPYVCPSCGTTLFSPCEVCGATRHTLLPYCESCGNEREITAPPAPPAAAPAAQV